VTALDSLILGLVQGLTEFLPVSSSGHLVIAEKLLHVNDPGVAFEVWLHLATLAAVMFALRADVARLLRGLVPGRSPAAADGRRLLLLLVVGTIPAVAVGLLASDKIEAAFDSVRVVGVDLLITAVILALSQWIPHRAEPLDARRAGLVGAAQAFAILPGVSRSGSTLVAGLALGLPGVEAARFSFLLAMPAILGAAVLEAKSLIALGETAPLTLALGFATALGSGYLAVQAVWKIMARGRLYWFAPYCAAVGALVLILT